MSIFRAWLGSAVALTVTISGGLRPPLAQAGPPADEAEFFEARIRPVLVEHCQKCHGPRKQKGGLRLDSRDALLKGGDSGPVVQLGDPEKSRLVTAIRYADEELRMPPKEKLPAATVEALTTWVKMGVPWPASAPRHPSGGRQPPESSQKKTQGANAPRSPETRSSAHWAFRPVADPPLPAVRDTGWARNGLDRFILAKLEAMGLRPAPEADRRTLLRRVNIDLIGLPPTPAEIDAFLADHSPDAYKKVVERLLASPRYGERWGRHWLDIARYADSKGYVFEEERRYPFAYTYRDWVIRAFNSDLPYDQFVIQQLAADRLPLGEDKHPLAALGFLTLGRRFLNNQADIIDDRIDVVSRGLLGLTVGCARCHDHKFDPIPQADYYSLYGVFASCTEPKQLPLLEKPEQTPAAIAFEAALKKREDAVAKYRAERLAAFLKQVREPATVAKYLKVARQARNLDPRKRRALARENDLSALLLGRWADVLAKANPPQDTAQLAKWLARPQGQAVLKQVLDVPSTRVDQLFNRAVRNKLRDLQRQADRLRATSPAATPRAMVLVDLPRPVEPYIFLRGNPGNRGPNVPRQFLEVLAGPQRQPFTHGSGRMELARAIAAKDNPLTARVFVNRVWGWHFGQGLVTTPSDFGMRSDPPSHPELLDWLASRFVADHWSIKHLHRLIVLSATYRQSAVASPQAEAADPDNRLLSRQNRRRLDLEALRDSLLLVAGQLDEKIGGAPVSLTSAPYSHRRTVYGFIDRQNLPGLFRNFDFASPDTHSPHRFTTTVPQQALFLLNSPFAQEQAKALAKRTAANTPEQRVKLLYRYAFGRVPTANEVEMGLAFVRHTPTAETGLTAWEQYAQVLLLANEFAFVD